MHRQPLVPLMIVAALCAGCGADQSDRPAVDGDASSAAAPAATNTAPNNAPNNASNTATAGQDSAPAQAASAEAALYTVDAQASEVYWKISKAGMMARFGHNHTISAEQFTGTVTVVENDLAASQFELEFPVDDLVVDDPELRAQLGEDFESVPTDEDKAGTRRNMLSEQLLHGEEHPYVRVRGSGPQTADATTLPVEIDVRGSTFSFDLPGEITVGDGFVEASGEFALEHADIGLMPFSALGGALQVGPTIEFVYRIRAVPAE